MKKLIMIFLLTLSAAGLFGDTIKGVLAFDSNKISFSKTDNYDLIEYKDKGIFYDTQPGSPFIPKYGFKILVPGGAAITNITITSIIKKVIHPSFNAYPTQQMVPIDGVSVFQDQDREIYETDAEFPYGDIIVHKGDSKIRGYQTADFALNLFLCNPVTGELSFIEAVEYAIEYESEPASTGGSARYNNQENDVFKELIQLSVENPQDIDTFTTPDIETFGVTESLSPGYDQIDLLIITSNDLKQAFETYGAYRTKTANITTKIVTVEDIYAQYSGDTDQVKIKKCIYNYVNNYNTNYVLLGGDQTEVPTQACPSSAGGHYTSTMPADVFYSCFDDAFDWDADGDGTVGEVEDDADLSPDVFLGRLPVRTAQQVTDYQNKFADYLYMAENRDNNMRSLLLTGATLSVEGDEKIKSEKIYDDYIKDYWKECVKRTLYASDQNVTLTDELLVAQLPGNNAVHMATHGTGTTWTMETGDKFGTDDAAALRGLPIGIIATTACNTNAFDSIMQEPSLSEAFIRNPHGGPLVYIGGSRLGWGWSEPGVHGASFQYNDDFFEHLFNNYKMDYLNTAGAAFAMAKQTEAPYTDDDEYMRWVHFSLNYMGDPTFQFLEHQEFFWWERVRNFDATAIAVGADGSMFALGDENYMNGSMVYKWNGTGWDMMPGMNAVAIDVDPAGNPWVVNKSGSIFYWTGSYWENKPGRAKDISVGGNGVVYMIDYSQGGSKGNYIAYWDGNSWTHITTIEAVSISVDDKGNPWIIDNTGHISFYDGTDWIDLPGKARDIAVNSEGKAFITGYEDTVFGHYIYRWTGSDWQKIFGEATQIEVGPNGAAYHVNNRQDLYFGHPEEDLLHNGDFHTYYRNGWKEYTMEGGAAEFSNVPEDDGYLTEDQELKVSITDGGDQKWSVLLTQPGITIEKGETYTISFWAKQENTNGQSIASDITVSLDAEPWTEYALFTTVFSDTFKRYSFTFTMDHETDKNAILQFCIGKLQRDVRIDSVSLVKHIKDSQAPSPITGLVLETTETTMTADWEASIDDYGVTEYLIRYKSFADADYTEVRTTDTTYTLTGLNPDTYYYMFVSAFDAAGNQSKEIQKGKYTLEQLTPPVPAWDPDQVYNGGELVSYNGDIYKAKWWTQGDTPGTTSVWELQ